MHVIVLLIGISDPKWPLALAADHAASVEKRILSPFDEAALETALKIRDADAEATITVVVAGGTEAEPVLRRAAAFRINRLVRLDVSGEARVDPRRLASILGSAIQAIDAECPLVLIGREFGDCDDGTVAPCLAAETRRHFFGLLQDMHVADGMVSLMRERDSAEEWLDVAAPVLGSVTNDRRNRLRHPLMKNVMAARTATFDVLESPGTAQSAGLTIALSPAKPVQRQSQCRLLEGPAQSQAAELASYLRGWR